MTRDGPVIPPLAVPKEKLACMTTPRMNMTLSRATG